jgi:hypothetical protein
VRPDRYVCGVFKEERADAFAAAFQEKLASPVRDASFQIDRANTGFDRS